MARNRIKTPPLRRALALQRTEVRALTCAVVFAKLSRRNEQQRRRFIVMSRLLFLFSASLHCSASSFFSAASPSGPLTACDYGVVSLLSFWPKSTWYSHFRFTFSDIKRLASFFFPPTLILPNKHGCVSAFDALVILLLRFTTASSLYMLESLVGFEDFLLSSILRTAAHYLVDHWFENISTPGWVDDNTRHRYADAIAAKRGDGSAATIIGFVDGTRKNITRPIVNQGESYNGWLHSHTLLFIAVAFPDGTFILRGPVSGRHNDLFAIDDTGLLAFLPHITNGYFIGGDGIFPVSSTIVSTKIYLHGLCPAEGAAQFAAVRVSVEWLFGGITLIFPYFSMETLQKLHLTAPALFYQAAAVLATAHNCFYRNEISQYFHVLPPSLSSIFHHKN